MKKLKNLSLIMAFIMILSSLSMLFSVVASAQDSGIALTSSDSAYEAKIGDQGYQTLEEAVLAAVSSSQSSSASLVTVELLKNATVDGDGITLGTNGGANFNVTINGNGHTVSNTLTSSAVTSTFYLWMGTLTLNNMTINTACAGAGSFGAIISRGATGNVIINNVNINNDSTNRHSSGAIIYINNNAKVTFSGTNTIRGTFNVFAINSGCAVNATEGSSTTVRSPKLGSSVSSSAITFIETSDPFEAAVASIGSTTYATLEAAVLAAVASSQANSAAPVTVELLKDATVDGDGITLGSKTGSNFTVTINGNGHTVNNTITLSEPSVTSTFYLWFGTLTLNNMTINTTCAGTGAFGAIISRGATGNVIVNNVNINNASSQRHSNGAIIFLNDNGTVTFSGTNVIRGSFVAFSAKTGCTVTATAGSSNTVKAPTLGSISASGITFVETTDPFDEAVASIGQTNYAALPDAFAAAKSGDIIVLRKNITVTDATRINCTISNTNVIFDGNGKTITSNGNVVLAFFNKADSSATSSVIVKDLTLISTDAASLGTVLQVNTGTKVTLYGCTLDTTAKNHFGVIYMKPSSELLLTSGTKIIPTAKGAAIHFEQNASASVEINQATIVADYVANSLNTGTKVTIGSGADITVNTGILNGTHISTLNILGGKLVSKNASAALITAKNADAKINIFGGSFEGGNAIFENTASGSKMSYATGNAQTILPTMTEGAAVRLAKDSSGLRFQTTISKSVIDYVNSVKDDGTAVTYGTVIAPASYVSKAGAFTMKALDACSDIRGNKYVNAAANNGIITNEDGSITVNVAFVNIKLANYQRAFAATGYICYTINGETAYVYTDYSEENNARSIYDVACAALADVSATADDTYKYSVEKYLVKGEDDKYIYSNGSAFSKYNATGLEILDNYFNLIGNHDELPYAPNGEYLSDIMQSVTLGNTVKNETVMFLDYGDEKTLLYPISSVISVTSYDGSKTYVEGKDYSIVNGKIKILEGSSIPCITRAVYYNYTANSTLITSYGGQNVSTYWGEGKPMTDYQVNVSYTHTESPLSFSQECQSDIYKDFLAKLSAGEDVTIIFYGDSITRGASSSWEKGEAPYQYPYSILFTEALADLYGYTVHYVASGIASSAKVPTSDYVAGTRGTITYINTAIGGWTSTDAINNVDNHIKAFAEQYGCDLFVCAFGMNDKSIAPSTTIANIKAVINTLLSVTPDASVMMVSTMVPNPNSTNGWYGNQPLQEEKLLAAAEEYRANGTACAVTCMTSMSLAVLERKDFNDYSGNNINHPNDFFIRVYAQTMIQALVGYENM